MNFDLMQNIKNRFKVSGIEFISQIDISNEEYNELLQYLREKLKSMQILTIPPVNEIFSVALVQIAMRVYSEGNYWSCFDYEIGECISQNKKYYLAQIFIKTIKHYKMFQLKQYNATKYSYVETIKAHAFVPNEYILNYFDFLFSFYDRNLFRQITDEIDYDIDDLIEFVTDSLNRDDDVIVAEKVSGKPAKSYKLLKSTKAVIAESTSNVIHDILYRHLIMMDDYYYDGKIPKAGDRFNDAFIKWVDMKNSEINSIEQSIRNRKTKEHFLKRPHFSIDCNKQQAYLIIPCQKFRVENYFNKAEVKIVSSKETFSKELEIYKAYGVFISEEVKLPINDLFDKYDVSITANLSKDYKISFSEYRIFDEEFCESGKLKAGTNRIFVKKGSCVNSDIKYRFINKEYAFWDEYCFDNVCENTVIYINGKPLSLMGDISDVAMFESVSKEYELFKDGAKLQTAYRHPIISFKLDAQNISGTRLFINNNIYYIEKEVDKTVYKFENAKIGVLIDINNIIECEDSVYQITLDEPGKNPQVLTKYVLITELRCRLSKPRYIFSETAEIMFEGDYNIIPKNCTLNECGKYIVDLQSGDETGKFELEFQNEMYELSVPLKVFKFGFEKNWQLMRPDFMWYTELKNELYLSIPGASEVNVYLNKDDSKLIFGEMYKPEKFKIDISKIVSEINNKSSSVNYINLNYLDNRWRRLSLYKVQTKPWIDKLSLVCNNGIMAIDAKFQSKIPILLKLFDFETEELVAEEYIENGITNMPMLSKDKLYKLERYEVEQDKFGFCEVATLIDRPIYKFGYIDYDDLSNCKMIISSIINNEKKLKLSHNYVVFNIQAEGDNIYYGKMTASQKDMKKNYTAFDKISFEVILNDSKDQVMSLNILEDGELFVPYYDSKTGVLISENSRILLESRELERFIPLYEDETTYFVEFRRIK